MKSFKLYICIAGIFMLNLSQIHAQSTVARIGYFMDNATHKHLLNPALVPYRGYVSYPALGAVNLDINSNMNITQFLYPGQTANAPLLTFMHKDVSPEQFLSKLNDDNYFDINQRLSILSFGFYTGTTFWNFEVASRINAGLNLPKGLFAFMKKGMSSSSGNEYEINNLMVNAGVMGETSLGSSFMIGEQIRVGLKGKLLVGGAKILAGIDEMTVKMNPDAWTISTNGLINVYGAGVEFNPDDNGVIGLTGGGLPVNLNPANINMAGLGFGLDLGASYKPFDFLEISAGIIDLGKINWNKNYNKVARSSGSVTFNGLDQISFGDDTGNGNIGDQLKDVTDNLMKMAEFREVAVESENLTENLTPNINLGVEAGVLKNAITLGVLYTGRLYPEELISELTCMLNFRPYGGLNISTSYTLLNGVEKTFGAAMAFNVGVANIFVACDYVPTTFTPQFIPISNINTNVQLGLSVSLGKMKNK